MKNILKGLLITIVAAGLMTGCSKQVNKSSIKEKLAGNWQWEKTDGGIGNNIHKTPTSTGTNIVLKITADGKYSIITNGTLSSAGTYILETKQCIHDQQQKTLINFSSDTDMMIEEINNEQLNLSDEAYDGLESQYKWKSSGN